MHPKRFMGVLNDPTWVRVLSFSLILFFIFLGDAILSFWVPNLLTDSFNSPVTMGLIMSFSSAVGFLVDLTFPQLIRGISVKRLLTYGLVMSVAFSISLLSALKFPWLLIFLFAMAVWGIYYDLFGFASQQFVADTLALKMRTGGWAILAVFKNLAYFLGPLMAAWLIVRAEWLGAATALFFTFIAFGLLVFIKRVHEKPLDIDVTQVDLWSEMDHWRVLIKRVWPIIVLSVMLGLIDATFWTTGTVLTESLTRQNFWGSFLLPMYQLPSLFMGLIVARAKIYEGKKKLAIRFLLGAGIILASLGFLHSVYLILAAVLVSSMLLAVTYPLTDATYTDVIVRMGRERKHMLGLSDSTLNLAYIVGPILAGFITKWVGEEMTFSVMGGATVLVALILMTSTPRKLKLPQEEIKTWDQ